MVGTTTLSGPYLISDLTGIDGYVKANINSASGAVIYVVQDAGNQQVNVGIVHSPK